jgi:hypothetical protein
MLGVGTLVAAGKVFSLAAGLGVGRAGLWRGLAVCRGADPVPESYGEEPEEPPIRAVIPVRLAALSDPDTAADPRPGSVAIPARRGVSFSCSGSVVAGLRFFAVLRTGWKGDTSPRNGCCAATWRLLAVNLLKPQRLREKSLRAGCCPATAG